MIRSRVDLPAPLSPRTPILAPWKKLSEMSLEHRLVRRMGPRDAVHGEDVLGGHGREVRGRDPGSG